jgi:hypothetical protein
MSILASPSAGPLCRDKPVRLAVPGHQPHNTSPRYLFPRDVFGGAVTFS